MADKYDKYLYVNNQFLPYAARDGYAESGMWDEKNGVFVGEDVFLAFPPTLDGKVRITGPDKMPAWGDAPSPTPEEIKQSAEQMKSSLRAAADSEIEWRQDAVDADIATDEEKTALAAWKKYRVLLMRVDTAAPVWPTRPGIND